MRFFNNTGINIWKGIATYGDDKRAIQLAENLIFISLQKISNDYLNILIPSFLKK